MILEENIRVVCKNSDQHWACMKVKSKGLQVAEILFKVDKFIDIGREIINKLQRNEYSRK